MTDGGGVDVVIPYFDDPSRLRSILHALDRQVDPSDGRPLEQLRVVVADDGSRVPPDVSGVRSAVLVVRHELDGFHAAAARNLGASVGSGEIVVFLDGDTIPTPHYVASLVAPIAAGGTDLTTGHRRHADFTGLDPGEILAWVSDPDTSRLLPEPTWLADGLVRTDLLRSGSAQSYQYVISAVLAVRRAAFDDVGGFDERFDSYGGEDWELAYRIWNAGWSLLHVPGAVAYHDGSDVEGREPDPRLKTVESLRIAEWIPASRTRLAGVRYEVPDLDVSLHLVADDLRSNATAVASILASRPGDLSLRLHGFGPDVAQVRHLVHDQRIVETDAPVHAGTRCLVDASGPVVASPRALAELTSGVVDGSIGSIVAHVDGVTIRATSCRLARRAVRSGRPLVDVDFDHAGHFAPVDDEGFADWARRHRGSE